MDQPSRIRRAPLILGWAGVIPFAGLALATVFGWNPLPISPAAALAAYGAAILSFMGGAQWGITVRGAEPERVKAFRYAASVLPSLLAWVCLLLWEPLALWGLAAGLALLLVYDLSTVRTGVAPRWYGSLRIQLTLAACLCLAAAAIAAA